MLADTSKICKKANSYLKFNYETKTEITIRNVEQFNHM